LSLLSRIHSESSVMSLIKILPSAHEAMRAS
jgi:hypothetical protein